MKKLILALAALSLSTTAFAMGSTGTVPTPAQAGVIGAREVAAIKAEVAKVVLRRNAVSDALKTTTSPKYGEMNIASARIDAAVKVKNRAVFDQEVAHIHALTADLCATMGGC